MKLLLLLTAYILFASAQQDGTEIEKSETKLEERKFYDLTKAQEYFEEFLVKYQKSYTDDEKQKRFEIFKEQLKAYNEKNALNGSVYEVTDLTDCSTDQGANCLGDDDDDDKSSPCIIVTDSQLTGPAPPTLDYRQKKIISPVKDQGRCQSCWAFTSVGCLEGAYAIKHGILLDLAPKQLMDCLNCSGHCTDRGSTMRRAFSELIDQPGVELDADYPYEDKDGPCKFNAAKAKVKVTGCTNFRLQKEAKLKEALAKYGPIGIGIYSDPLTGYKGGIVSVLQCPPPVPPQKVNHAVLLVGYGKEKGKEFWIIKNSHGTRFGENGYVRLEMGKNVCGLLNTHAAAAAVV